MLEGTFSIGYGMVADIATPAERGSFAGVLAFGYCKSVDGVNIGLIRVEQIPLRVWDQSWARL